MLSIIIYIIYVNENIMYVLDYLAGMKSPIPYANVTLITLDLVK